MQVCFRYENDRLREREREKRERKKGFNFKLYLCFKINIEWKMYNNVMIICILKVFLLYLNLFKCRVKYKEIMWNI